MRRARLDSVPELSTHGFDAAQARGDNPCGSRETIMANTSVSCNPLSSGNVRLGGKLGDVELNPAAVSEFVRDLLLSAIAAHQQSGRPHPQYLTELTTYPYLRPSSMGLGPCPEPNYECCLILHFGEAQIGMALSMSEARALGEGLIAASVPRARPQ